MIHKISIPAEFQHYVLETPVSNIPGSALWKGALFSRALDYAILRRKAGDNRDKSLRWWAWYALRSPMIRMVLELQVRKDLMEVQIIATAWQGHGRLH